MTGHHQPLTSEDVAELLGEQVPSLAGQTVTRLRTTGTDHDIFRLGSGHAARFPREPDASEGAGAAADAESRAVNSFADAAGVPAPRSLAVGRPAPGYPGYWSVQTWVEGDVADPRSFVDSFALAGDLADLLARLRALDTRGRTFSGKGRGGRLQNHDAWVEECLARSEGLLDTAALRGLWSRLRELPELPTLAMSHRDLIPSNLLVGDGRLVGVLDAGGFGPADPALDLVSGWHLLGEKPRAALRAKLGAGAVEWARGAAWAFAQAIGLVWYYEESNPAMSELGRSTLARVLSEGERLAADALEGGDA